ncbi:HNH endonuclease signature motif containing protein [Labrys sp. 22185]|uniref:HNH endonuclease signature motif containing protein n=1 Tax=Labrys sp. 22185 TaxID=3453888 RepID=UPI003F8329FF
MPSRAPRLCICGRIVAGGARCVCQQQRKAETDRRRPTAHDRGYGAKWRSAREGFLAKHRRCIRCDQPATVVDHKIPHKGDMRLFWDRNNWQPLCSHCHNSFKQSLEKSR